MKIKVSAFCNECKKDSENDEIFGIDGIVEFNDENWYTLTCVKGHLCHTKIQAHKYELLFDQGALAIIDGYSKESVSSFSSSLERFIEYFLKIITIHHSVTFENFVKTWKLLARQSERQLGSFYFAQSCEWKEVTFLLDEKKTNFRNNVIHQGYIPSTSEAIEYGEYVLKFIIHVIKKLKETHPEAYRKGIIYQLFSSGNPMPNFIPSTTKAIPTIIGFTNSKELDKINFQEIIGELTRNGFYKQFYIRKM
ncbi:MAG: hypothetical protein IPO63_16735 [Bacteroidetes bacterium]|nr:hypothetical protein [Bacteroidota bacterium]